MEVAQHDQQQAAAAQAPKLNLPALGAELAGGLFAGITTGKDGVPYALLLLATLPTNAEMTWRDAMAWAEGVQADLPTRVESAMLYANLKDQFEQDWYWTNEQHASYTGCAWYQDFYYGYQGYGHKGAELRARAVRRLPIQSLTI